MMITYTQHLFYYFLNDETRYMKKNNTRLYLYNYRINLLITFIFFVGWREKKLDWSLIISFRSLKCLFELFKWKIKCPLI